MRGVVSFIEQHNKAGKAFQDSEGRTILYATARNPANASKTWEMYRGLVELLIAKGAEVNVKDHCGETPLHVVARQYDEEKASEICELLHPHLPQLRKGWENGAQKANSCYEVGQVRE